NFKEGIPRLCINPKVFDRIRIFGSEQRRLFLLAERITHRYFKMAKYQFLSLIKNNSSLIEKKRLKYVKPSRRYLLDTVLKVFLVKRLYHLSQFFVFMIGTFQRNIVDEKQEHPC